ncbi:hypothetical protein [Lysinibacillus sp. FSL L8-0126]|uniref:hypothetical protein n=1 Tax=Lysinibacillus sp. FSL L8-0126 TaxID=2921515 RepID=UPI00315AD046
MEQQKEYVRAKLSEKIGLIYRQRKVDMIPIFLFLKDNLRFTRFLVSKMKLSLQWGQLIYESSQQSAKA